MNDNPVALPEVIQALIEKLKAEADMQNKCGLPKVRDLLLEAVAALSQPSGHISDQIPGLPAAALSQETPAPYDHLA